MIGETLAPKQVDPSLTSGQSLVRPRVTVESVEGLAHPPPRKRYPDVDAWLGAQDNPNQAEQIKRQQELADSIYTAFLGIDAHQYVEIGNGTGPRLPKEDTGIFDSFDQSARTHLHFFFENLLKTTYHLTGRAYGDIKDPTQEQELQALRLGEELIPGTSYDWITSLIDDPNFEPSFENLTERTQKIQAYRKHIQLLRELVHVLLPDEEKGNERKGPPFEFDLKGYNYTPHDPETDGIRIEKLRSSDLNDPANLVITSTDPVTNHTLTFELFPIAYSRYPGLAHLDGQDPESVRETLSRRYSERPDENHDIVEEGKRTYRPESLRISLSTRNKLVSEIYGTFVEFDHIDGDHYSGFVMSNPEFPSHKTFLQIAKSSNMRTVDGARRWRNTSLLHEFTKVFCQMRLKNGS